MPDVVFDIERMQALVLREIKPALDMNHVFLHADIDVGFLDAWHFEDDRQSILRFVESAVGTNTRAGIVDSSRFSYSRFF